MELVTEAISLLAANASNRSANDTIAQSPADQAAGSSWLAANASSAVQNATANASAVFPSALHSTNDLAFSLLMDACVLVGGFACWKIMRLLGIGGPPRSQRGDEPSLCSRAGLQTTVARNYVLFLKACRDMFVALSVISAATTIPYWGPSPLAVGLLGPKLSTTAQLDSTGLSFLCLDTALRGLVALVFVERLQRKFQKPVLSESATDSIHRTLWLSDLPVYDRETAKPFEFWGEDFHQVAQDLETAINKEFKKRTVGEYVPATMQVHVAPVVDNWYDVSLRLRTAQERLEVYRELQKFRRSGCGGCLESLWYSRLYRRYSKQAQALGEDLGRIERGPKRISGTAFVTFQNAKHRDYFLKNRPRCWQFRDHTYFGFGRPPFASATLACTRAPHPDDVNWTNLHVGRMHQRFWLVFLTFLLFVFMVVLVTPVTVTSQLATIITEVEHKLEKFAVRTHSQTILVQLKGGWVEKVTNQAPAVLLVVINSLLLPEIIYRISVVTKPHRKSSVEVIQLHLNATFLILNSLVIPFLEMNSINALMKWAEVRVHKHPGSLMTEVTKQISQTMMHSTGIFALRYIVNCACLTNMNSLLQIPQLLCRAHARRGAKTARESVDAEEAWVFAWGYWYAWTISIFTMGLFMSSAVPSALPCAALFFTVQHVVDRYNLTNRIYQHGPDIETENLLATRVLHYMRCVIAVWWFIMGSTYQIILRTTLAAVWDAPVPLEWVHGLSMALVGASVALVIFSWYTQLSILHDNQFQNVNLSERGLSSTGGGVLQPLFHGIDGCLRFACCKQVAQGEYHSVEQRGRRARLDTSATEALGARPLERVPSAVSESDVAEAPLSWNARSVVIQPVAECRPL